MMAVVVVVVVVATSKQNLANLPIECSVKLIFGEPLINLIILGGMIRFMAGYAIGSYLPDFYSEVYPDYNNTYKRKGCSTWQYVAVRGAVS